MSNYARNQTSISTRPAQGGSDGIGPVVVVGAVVLGLLGGLYVIGELLKALAESRRQAQQLQYRVSDLEAQTTAHGRALLTVRYQAVQTQTTVDAVGTRLGSVEQQVGRLETRSRQSPALRMPQIWPYPPDGSTPSEN